MFEAREITEKGLRDGRDYMYIGGRRYRPGDCLLYNGQELTVKRIDDQTHFTDHRGFTMHSYMYYDQKWEHCPDRNADKETKPRTHAAVIADKVRASEHGIRQIEKIAALKLRADFNQGLDARYIDDVTARLLAKVKWLKPIRLACDSQAMIPHIRRAVELLRWHNATPRKYSVYVLVQDVKDALDRVHFLKGLNVEPFAHIRQSVDKRGVIYRYSATGKKKRELFVTKQSKCGAEAAA